MPGGESDSRPNQQRAILACSEGSAHRANGDYEKARTCLEKALTLWPRYWEAINDLGVVYYHQQHYQKALEQFTAALAIKEDADLHLNLGLTYRSLGQAEKAITHFSAALERMQDGPAAGSLRWELARLELERQDVAAAVRHWEKIVQRADPSWSEQAAQLIKKYRPSAP